MKGDEIQERLIEFSAWIIGVCDALPNTVAGKLINLQLLGSVSAQTPHNA